MPLRLPLHIRSAVQPVLDGPPCQPTCSFTKPNPDAGLAYYYALFEPSTGKYVNSGVLAVHDQTPVGGGETVDLGGSNNKLVPSTGTTMTFKLTGVPNGDYKIRLGVKNGNVLAVGSSDGDPVQRVGGDTTAVTSSPVGGTLLTDVRWSDAAFMASSEVVEVGK